MAQPFDPAAATAAYLAVLTPAQHAKATAYTHGSEWLLLWQMLVAVLVAWLVLKSGLLVRTRDAVERRRPHPWLAVMAVVAADTLIETVLGLPWDVYAHWWREKAYGLSNQAIGGFLADHATELLIGVIVNLVMFSFLYWAIRRAPRTWWAWGGAVVAVGFMVLMLVQPVVFEPLFNHYRPAPPGPMREEIVAMARQVGVPSDKILIYNGSKQSNRYSANVSGLGATSRIAMSDVMFQKDADLAEVRGVVGHEMGHYVHKHIFIDAALYGLVGVLCFFLVDRLFPLFVRLLGARGVAGLADPAGLPVIGAVVAVLSLLGAPLIASITRVTEADADRFSLEQFNEPDGLSKALVKTIEYRASAPSALEEFLFYNHESVGHRVRKAMDWKAQHPKPPSP